MNNSFLHLRNEYPEFVYEDFNVIETEIEYKVTYIFRLKELTFKPVITISKKQKNTYFDVVTLKELMTSSLSLFLI